MDSLSKNLQRQIKEGQNSTFLVVYTPDCGSQLGWLFFLHIYG